MKIPNLIRIECRWWSTVRGLC